MQRSGDSASGLGQRWQKAGQGPWAGSPISRQSSCGSFLVAVASTCLPTSSKITGRDSRFIMSMDCSWVLARSSSTWGGWGFGFCPGF